jgi:PST family polysaccharide transporter
MDEAPHPPMATPSAAPALSHVTVRATAWTIATGLGTRLLGVVGTLILTRFILPYDYGEVSAACILVWTANQISTLNVGTYILAHPRSGRDVMFHATLLHVIPGLVASGLVWGLGWRFGAVFDAPTVGRYLPGMVLSTALDRVLYMPERVLVRNMRFGSVSISRGVGELTYTGVSIGAAALGFGGMAIVIGNVARSLVRFVVTAAYVNWRDWLQATRLRAAIFRDMFRFGVPVAVGSLAGFGTRRWDNLVISRFFGPAVLGTYNLAYNLADIPAVQVGEQISDVLQAAFSRIDGGDSRRALLRSLEILAFIMTPMAVGMACIAPTLTTAFFNRHWVGVGPMLAVLAVISFTRPISNTVGGYLQVRRQPRVSAIMDVVTLALMMLALFTLGRVSPLWACAAVGLVFTLRMIIWAFVLRSVEQIALRDFLGPLLPPVLACLPLVAAVVGLQRVWPVTGRGSSVALLVVEVVAGALAYAGASLVVARGQLSALVALLRGGLGRRR